MYPEDPLTPDQREGQPLLYSYIDSDSFVRSEDHHKTVRRSSQLPASLLDPSSDPVAPEPADNYLSGRARQSAPPAASC